MAVKRSKFEYGALLNRARSDLPEELTSDSRWSVPDPDLLVEGRTTIVRNYKDILDALRRDEAHVTTYMLRELGTAGDSDGDRLIFTAKLQLRQVQERLSAYVDTYVMCDECHRPDTHLTKDGRTTLLKCDACGAHKPVKAKKRRDEDGAGSLGPGKIIEIEITGKNEKGLPFGTVGDVKVFVPGATVGATVKAQIDRVVGATAVAKPVS